MNLAVKRAYLHCPHFLPYRYFCTKKKIKTVWILKDDTEQIVEAEIGKHLLAVAHENKIELEGACEASLACSTCHVILDETTYDKLEEPTDDEYDLLDLAFGLTPTSRLGCQVLVSEELEGVRIRLPKATRNFFVDGHVPEPH